MKKYLIIGVLAVLGLLASLLLMPRSNEIALMQFKDKRFEEARTAYEKQLESGKITVDVANGLTDLYLQYGRIDDAVKIMERFVKENPRNIESREELGKIYQYAQTQIKNLDYDEWKSLKTGS